MPLEDRQFSESYLVYYIEEEKSDNNEIQKNVVVPIALFPIEADAKYYKTLLDDLIRDYVNNKLLGKDKATKVPITTYVQRYNGQCSLKDRGDWIQESYHKLEDYTDHMDDGLGCLFPPDVNDWISICPSAEDRLLAIKIFRRTRGYHAGSYRLFSKNEKDISQETLIKDFMKVKVQNTKMKKRLRSLKKNIRALQYIMRDDDAEDYTPHYNERLHKWL